MENADIKYLKVLATQYPNIAAAATEIVNLKAILSLPKATEHFITDVHGEYEQFRHVMCNGSGAVQRKIEDEFGSSLGIPEKRTLATLIYYPELKIKQIEGKLTQRENLEDWYKVTIFRLIRVCKNASSKYTRSKVRKSLPKDFAYIIEELMTGRPDVADQEAYYNEIINSVIHTGRAAQLIIDFCYLVRRFTVDHLHVVGDIFDRGPYPHLIMDDLMTHHSVDIQWGNHDILWMGAAAGSVPCMCNMLRISARYGNLAILEDAYGINMIPLMRLAIDCYQGHTSKTFNVHVRDDDKEYDRDYAEMDAMMHKAITIIQFKVEGQLIKKHPEWNMKERLLLDKIDYKQGTIKLGGKEYPLNDTYFPTIDPQEKQRGEDILWFIWKNKHSPVFGKERMATFERYFIDATETHEEPKNAYYRLFEKEEIVDKILKEFGLPVQGAHIINGHIPVIVKKGESPVKCGGKLLVIDGGFSKAYQPKTGIAGYTLIYNSYGLVLAAHEPFTSMEDTVLNETCIHSHIVMQQNVVKRKTVNDTDTGKVLRENIAELEELLQAYRSGMLVEKF